MDPSRSTFKSDSRKSFNPRNKAMQRLKRRADNRNNDLSKVDFSLDFTRHYNNDRAHNETNPDISHRNKHFNKYYY